MRIVTYFWELTHTDRPRSSWVGRWVRLSVCLSVCLENNSKTNNSKVFKLGIGNQSINHQLIKTKFYSAIPRERILGYPTSDMIWRLKGQRSRLGLGLTAIRRGCELYECLLVVVAAALTKRQGPCCTRWRRVSSRHTVYIACVLTAPVWWHETYKHEMLELQCW